MTVMTLSTMTMTVMILFNRHMFVTLDCGETVKTYRTIFSPRHLEFDKELEGKKSP